MVIDMMLLELFSGTHSIGNIARSEFGMDVFSVDVSDEYAPHYVTDIMDIDLKRVDDLAWLPSTVGVIWASPPCTCFSVASIGKYWSKSGDVYTPKTDSARHALKIVEKTFEIIRHYEQRNPVSWYIENPRGMLRKMAVVRGVRRNTVT